LAVIGSIFETFKGSNNLELVTDIIDYMRWPEVELNHRHTDFQSVDLKPQLTDIKLHTLFITSSVELM